MGQWESGPGSNWWMANGWNVACMHYLASEQYFIQNRTWFDSIYQIVLMKLVLMTTTTNTSWFNWDKWISNSRVVTNFLALSTININDEITTTIHATTYSTWFKDDQVYLLYTFIHKSSSWWKSYHAHLWLLLFMSFLSSSLQAYLLSSKYHTSQQFHSTSCFCSLACFYFLAWLDTPSSIYIPLHREDSTGHITYISVSLPTLRCYPACVYVYVRIRIGEEQLGGTHSCNIVFTQSGINMWMGWDILYLMAILIIIIILTPF